MHRFCTDSGCSSLAHTELAEPAAVVLAARAEDARAAAAVAESVAAGWEAVVSAGSEKVVAGWVAQEVVATEAAAADSVVEVRAQAVGK